MIKIGRGLSTNEWQHLMQTQDDEIKRLTKERDERAEWAGAWHKALETVATILEVPSAGSDKMLLEDISGAITQLRGTLSLAEEGLANYQQENGELRAALVDLRKGIEDHATDTVWYSPIETACDRITAILAEPQPREHGDKHE